MYLPIKFDLTSQRSYTLTSYSKSVLSNIKTNFEIEYYFSEELVLESNIVPQIIYFLKQIESNSEAKIRYISSKDSEFDKGLVKYQPENIGEKDLYNFITIRIGDKYKTIPSIPIAETIEFEVIRVINYLVSGKLKQIGILVGNDEITKNNFNNLYSTLQSHFYVEFLEIDAEIPEYIDSIIVIGHYALTNNHIHNIEHFLSHGKSMFFAGNGLSTNEGLQYRETPMLSLLREMGLVVEPYLIGSNNSIDYIEDDGSITKYPLNIITYPNRTLKNNTIINPFTGFSGLHTSPIMIKNGDFNYLLKSSKDSWLVDSITGLDGVPESSYNIAVSGVTNIFTKPSRIVALGNNLSLTDFGTNYDFIVRSMYYLVSKEDLLTLRHKVNWDKSLFKVEDSIIRGTILKIISIILFIYPLITIILLKGVFYIFSKLFRIRFKY
ncbi:MAG: GldG family protein [Spirochaetales bacterium]|nr:GldG family protein [Spirochaetales bacterium]